MLCILGFFINEMECERGKQDFSNKVIVLNATISISITTKANLLRKSLICSPWKSEQYIIPYPVLKKRTTRLKRIYRQVKKVMQRVERNIIKTVYDSPQSSTRGLALQVEKNLGLRVSHETIRNVLEKHKYSSKVAKQEITICYRTRFTSFGVLG